MDKESSRVVLGRALLVDDHHLAALLHAIVWQVACQQFRSAFGGGEGLGNLGRRVAHAVGTESEDPRTRKRSALIEFIHALRSSPPAMDTKR